jgi:D-lactate dehydrogenase
MKVSFYSTQPYDKESFDLHNRQFAFTLEYHEASLNEANARLSRDAQAICVFVNDKVTGNVVEQLAAMDVRIIALRCAGFNNVDLKAASHYKIKVVRVPAYSPYAVAEHAVAMIMTLNRKTHKAFNRIREQNFSLTGLMGFDLYGKTVGVVGTGNIGKVFCNIMLGFGCRVVACDLNENEQLTAAGVSYVSLESLLSQSDVISLHCPLNEQTQYIIGGESIPLMKKGVMLINTSRGALVDTKNVIKALKSGHIGALGIDVYEQEETLFFRNLSENIIEDDTIARLTTFPNVLITAHQGFFTREAMDQIAHTTLSNLQAFERGNQLVNEVSLAG